VSAVVDRRVQRGAAPAVERPDGREQDAALDERMDRRGVGDVRRTGVQPAQPLGHAGELVPGACGQDRPQVAANEGLGDEAAGMPVAPKTTIRGLIGLELPDASRRAPRPLWTPGSSQALSGGRRSSRRHGSRDHRS